MAVYAIGDLHLSHGVEKPMDVFSGWENYMERIEENWAKTVSEEDTVVLVGDTSWAMKMEEAIADFQVLDKLPGTKLVVKGNHDFWWGSVTSMYQALEEAGISSIRFLHNNHYVVDDLAICGSRGWLFEDGAEHDVKIVRREAIRLENSLQSVADPQLEKVVFIHYPPIYSTQEIPEFLDVMNKFHVRQCYYGHIHGEGHRYATQGNYKGIHYTMISADYLGFTPLKL